MCCSPSGNVVVQAPGKQPVELHEPYLLDAADDQDPNKWFCAAGHDQASCPPGAAGPARAPGPAVGDGRPPRRVSGLAVPLHRLPPGHDPDQPGGRPGLRRGLPVPPVRDADRARHLHHRTRAARRGLPARRRRCPATSPCSGDAGSCAPRRSIGTWRRPCSPVRRPGCSCSTARTGCCSSAASTPAAPDRGSWWFTPGGGLDPGESHRDGAVRELFEETGLRCEAERR